MIVNIVEKRNDGLFKILDKNIHVASVEGLAEIATMFRSRGIELETIKRRSDDSLIMIFQGNGAK